MSSLSSVFNVAAALYTNDIYKPRHQNVSEHKLVLIGRLVTIVLIFLAILCVPLVRQINSQIYLYLQSVQAYFGPPIAALFVTGLLIKQINAKGALWGLIVGESMGILRLIIDIAIDPGAGTYSLLSYYGSINFLHLAIIIFVISTITTYLVSIVSSRKKAGEISSLNLVVKIPGIWDLGLGTVKISLVKADKINISLSILIVIVVLGVWSIWS